MWDFFCNFAVSKQKSMKRKRFQLNKKITPESKKEVGKWLMDIAKYTLTAAIVTSFLGEFGQPWLFYGVGIFIVTLCFVYGLIIFNDNNN
jgi:hypothetical protein